MDFLSPTVLSNPNQPAKCRFCGYLSGERSKKIIDSPWLQSKDYGALVSIGTLVPGWTLVCPKQHCLNMSTHYQNSEFWSFANEVEQILSKQYGPVAVFEHGAFSENSATSCGTGHAHMHFVPLNFALFLAALEFDGGKTWIASSASDVERLSAGKEYLFVADSFKDSQKTGHLCILNNSTSQFFRKVIADRLGIPELFDYKVNQMLEIAESSVTELIALRASSEVLDSVS